MTICKKCNQSMEAEINFCPTCGEDQGTNNLNQHKGNATLLIILCTLTIIGSVFTIARAFLYEMVSMMGENNNYSRGWVYAGSAIGTLVGAIMMIQRKLKGLYVYSAFQIVYIITVLVATFSYGDAFDSFNGDHDNKASFLAFGIAMFFLLPSIIFLILFWTNMIKKHLK